jgi:hypothetical protein
VLLGIASAVGAVRCGDAQPVSRLTPTMRAQLDSIARLEQASLVRHATTEELMRITARLRRSREALHATQTRDEAHRAVLVYMCELEYISDEYGWRDGNWLHDWTNTHPPRSQAERREQERRVSGLMAMGVFDPDGKCDSLAPLRDTSEIRLRTRPDTTKVR